MTSHVLFITPYTGDAARLSEMVRPLPVEFEHAQDLGQARSRLGEQSYAVILTEAGLPDGTWMDVLDAVRDAAPDVPVIVTDALADTRFWAEVLNLGAYDLVAQPFAEAEVRRILGNACSRAAAGAPGRRFYNGFSTRRSLCPQPPMSS